MQPIPTFRAPLAGVPVHGETPYAEATADGPSLRVDIWSPDRTLDELDVHVEAHAIHLVSRRQPGAFHVAIVLPVPVVAGVHVTRWHGSVIEVRMLIEPSP